MLDRFRLSTRILLLGIIITVCISAIFFYIYPKVRQGLIEAKYLKTRHVVETAWGILDYYAKQVQSNNISIEEGKQRAIEEVKNLRYEKEEYFWINDMEPRMIMHPFKPELNGKSVSDNKDPNGKPLFMAMVDKVKSDGAGFVDYYWPKPGSTQPVAKISYVKGLPEWGWIIGSGIYIDDVTAELNRMLYVILGALALVALGGIFLAYAMARSISRPVIRVMHELDGAAAQVAAGASQVSAASHTLAEGVSEHAAGIEETSSTMEEVASMTKRNAEHARQADIMMRDTSQVVDEVNLAMTDLTQSMNEISQASQETAKIIRTIDEIAFQTNLLALNAAVEAARAGEAGAGFAVVADEVRNLAMRAADAAKNTASLIEGTVNKIKKGSEVVVRTNDAFGKMAAGAKKIGELVGDIAVASEEQSQGIGQINIAIAEMDKVIQQNAAIAEESASASQEMSAQTRQMNRSVEKLARLVHGNASEKAAKGIEVVSRAKGVRSGEVDREVLSTI